MDHHAWHAVKQLRNAGILHTVTPTNVLTKFAAPITDVILQDMHDRKFLDRCEAFGGHLTSSLIQVPHDLQTDRPCAT